MSIENSVQKLADKLIKNQQIITTAESCTGGMIAQTLTDLAGSSAWFDCGFVTYSNESKQEMLGVKKSTLVEFGAVSEAVVIEMAEGALKNSNASCSISCSGVAGPGGGSADKPVGTVWVAWAFDNKPTQTQKFYFTGNRQQVREQCTFEAIKLMSVI